MKQARPPTFRERLRDGPPLLLDGAVGSELDRRGVDVSLPLWSARALLEAPSELLTVHREYAAAGADILTADTFRVQRRTLARAGVQEQATELSAVAVHIARAAASAAAGGAAAPVFIAGSMAPLEDCYRPDLVPDAAELEVEHAEIARDLAATGVDLLLLETMNTAREAVAATRAALATGLPVLVSLVCDGAGKMLSGEDPGQVAASLAGLGADGVLVNCAPAPELLHALRRVVEAVGDLPSGGYGNVGHADEQGGWVNTDAIDPKEYSRYAAAWLDAGARIVGGCCGTTPGHIRALRTLINGRSGVFSGMSAAE